MKDDGSEFIESALAAGFISPKQAGLMRDELFMFPGQNARQLMIKRGWITPEQANHLDGSTGTGSVVDGETNVPGNLPPVPQVPPPIPGQGVSSMPARPTPSSQSTPQSQSPARQAPQPFPRSAPGHPQGPYANQPPPQPPRPMQTRPQGPSPGPASSPPAAQNSSRSPYAPPPPAPLDDSPSLSPQPPLNRRTIPAHRTPGQPAATPPSEHKRRRDDILNIRTPSASATLQDYLAAARRAGCSDIHFSIGRPPFVRFQGVIDFLEDVPITVERSRELNLSMLSEEQKAILEKEQQLDFALEIPGLGRHRCNVFRQRLGWEGVYRIIPQEVPTLDELGMPPVLKKLTEYHQGLVLVTGAGGCGKTTTVAAMLDYINQTRNDHIITVEDPVEYVIPPKNCHITQREVGPHTQSFGNALRGALRQDPDVIMVGELRDIETTSIAISAAETGHLVFATLHTNSALRTVARIMDVYPPAQRAQICTMVAESLRGIISQQLIPRKGGNGRVLAMEILVFTSGVSQIIKEGKTHQLVSLMQSGKRIGMRTMDDALMELFQQGEISGREAYARCDNKPAFESIKGQD